MQRLYVNTAGWKRYALDGTVLLEASTAGTVPALAVDTQQRVATIERVNFSGEVHRYDADGAPVWSYTNSVRSSSSWGGVAIDDDGAIYFSSSVNANGFGKLSAAGTLQWWAANVSRSATELTFGPPDDGHIFFGLDDGVSGKQTVDNQQEWELSSSGGSQQVSQIAVDADGYSYIAARFLRKVSPTGTVLWTHGVSSGSHYTGFRGVAVDQDGNVYAVAENPPQLSGLDPDVLLKFSPSGNLLWDAPINERGESVVVDADGDIYVAARGFRVHKFGPDGNEVWNLNPGGRPTALAITPVSPGLDAYLGSDPIVTAYLGDTPITNLL